MQLPCCLGKQGELSENCLQNLGNDLTADSVIWRAYIALHICFRKWRTGRTGHSCRMGRGPGRRACRPACRRERCSPRSEEDGCNGSGGARGCRRHCGAMARRMN